MALKKIILWLLPEFLVIKLQRFIFKTVDLSFRFSTGIRVQIMSRAEWGIYNDIWVDRVYDSAIESAGSGGKPLTLLDLGANLGFFSLRCGHLLCGRNFVVYAIEGCPQTFLDLENRLVSQKNFRRF